jgi:apolipoprotein N-acyltransferase
VFLSAAELARSYVFTGFPWALIGHVWVDWAPMQLAAWVGPLGLTLVTVLPVALGVVAFQRKTAALLAIFAACAGFYGFGLWQQAQPMPETGPETENAQIVRLVQPNAAQHLKWDPDYAPLFFRDAVDFTRAPATPRPDLIIWPETAVPVLLERAEAAFQRITAAADGVPLVLGIQRYDGILAYNSLVYLDEQGELTALYDKHHLVPFGEYLPGSGLFANTRLAGLVGEYGYSAGPGAQLVDLGPLGRVLPLICYEAIFPQDVRAAPERPDWLLQITNDAWFGTLSGPYQHLAQARLRAVEQGLPFVRAANTGVSAVIDARGNVTAFLGLGQAGYLDAALPPALPETLYAKTGDAPMALFLTLLGLLIFASKARKPIDARKAGP